MPLFVKSLWRSSAQLRTPLTAALSAGVVASTTMTDDSHMKVSHVSCSEAALPSRIKYGRSTIELLRGPEALARADSLQSDRLQLYFMCEGIDYAKGKWPAFFVTKGSPHEDYYGKAGGICATVDPGNPAGYVGGLTGNKAIAVGMYGDTACTMRDYVHMRKNKTVAAVCKGGQTPLFGPPAWEELHALLRQLAFQDITCFEYGDRQRMFSNSSDSELAELHPEGIAMHGRSIQCFWRDGCFVCTSGETGAELDVNEDLKSSIRQCMGLLGLRYSNAVFDGVSSLEDSGFAFFHHYDLQALDGDFCPQRNKGLVYAVGPNANKERYPDDVHIIPTMTAWKERMRLLGSNIATAVAMYNKSATAEPQDCKAVTVLRTAVVAGGMFMHSDIDLPTHTAHFLSGLLDVLHCPAESGVLRLELMSDSWRQAAVHHDLRPSHQTR
eukprot:TRINITY_DN44855_c0_g1_i1.p1 TRINITY_DN44855_c0_g1~~TRINITY_DN44855_c0_g1_i1.p1  ORF type:complete len:440 (+),score=76.52 TRINITY_DN44855_c0_g1_i1:78-1397(+)